MLKLSAAAVVTAFSMIAISLPADAARTRTRSTAQAAATPTYSSQISIGSARSTTTYRSASSRSPRSNGNGSNGNGSNGNGTNGTRVALVGIRDRSVDSFDRGAVNGHHFYDGRGAY